MDKDISTKDLFVLYNPLEETNSLHLYTSYEAALEDAYSDGRDIYRVHLQNTQVELYEEGARVHVRTDLDHLHDQIVLSSIDSLIKMHVNTDYIIQTAFELADKYIAERKLRTNI